MITNKIVQSCIDCDFDGCRRIKHFAQILSLWNLPIKKVHQPTHQLPCYQMLGHLEMVFADVIALLMHAMIVVVPVLVVLFVIFGFLEDGLRIYEAFVRAHQSVSIY